METNKDRITLKELKEQVILPNLAKTSFRYRVLTNTGAYEKAYRSNNLRVGTITALIQTTESEVMILGGGLNAVALNASIRFLVPVNDINDPEGSYPIITKFCEEITEHLTLNGKLELEANGKTYIGAVSTSFPVGGELDIRPSLGNSFTFTVYMEFAYVQNALNSSDVEFYLGGDSVPIPYTHYSVTRKNTLTGNLYSDSSIGQANTYAESSTFGIDMSLPAMSDNGITAGAIKSFLYGKRIANYPYNLHIKNKATNTLIWGGNVIFGEAVESGQGTENVTWQISLVPYLEAEDEG